MEFNCENCGWSKDVESHIFCGYSEKKTFQENCCEAWKPKNNPVTMPTIDVVPVIRCKNCKYHTHGPYSGSICELTNFHMKDDDYCSKAKRKENE